jgi:hypothetical protein
MKLETWNEELFGKTVLFANDVPFCKYLLNKFFSMFNLKKEDLMQFSCLNPNFL